MDEEKLQERACRLVEEEDVPVLPPLQGLKCKMVSADEWFSSDVKEKENEK